MIKHKRTLWFAALVLGGFLLGNVQQANAAYNPNDFKPPPPMIQVPPPVVITEIPPPVVTTTGGGCCHHCGGDPPGGTTQHAPEPASLVSGLLGAGLLGLFASRRKKQVVTVA
jgi:PEP-CTERM motif